MAKEEYTKRVLADSLRQLIRQKPYASITVSDIVRNCGLSRHTFYYHFRDKQDLVMWIYLDTRAQAIEITSIDTVYGNMSRLLNLMYENSLLYTQIRYDTDQNGFREGYFNANYHCFRLLIKSYLGDRKLNPVIRDYIAHYFTWAGSEVFFDMMEGKLRLPVDEAIDVIRTIWEKGLFGALDMFAEMPNREKEIRDS